MTRFGLIALVVALLAACASMRQHEGEPSARERFWYYAGQPVPSFMSAGGISGWRPLARHELVVWTRVNNAYLLTVDPTCYELETAIGISLESRVGSTISSGFDHVRVGNNRCVIREIRPIDYRLMKQEERELREDKAKEKQ